MEEEKGGKRDREKEKRWGIDGETGRWKGQERENEKGGKQRERESRLRERQLNSVS